MGRAGLLLACLSLSLFVTGCDDDDGPGADTEAAGSGDAGAPCNPGETIGCGCPDGSQGSQTCEAAGDAYGPCSCGGGTSSSGGTTTTGSASGADTTAGTGDGGGGSTGAMPPNCEGSHPLLEGDLRFCEPGGCYCGDLQAQPPVDACYAAAVAEACCPVEVVCY